MRKLLVCVGFAALLFACGDNHMSDDTPDIDARTGDGSMPDAEVPDAGPSPDAFFCPAQAAGDPGGACVNHTDCESAPGANDGLCYAGIEGPVVFPAEGYCTIDDNSGTVCATDDDCGTGGQCVDSEGYKFCLPACCMFDTCPSGQACFDSFNGFPLDKSSCVPGDGTAEDGDACGGFYDCNQDSLCRAGVEFPGGQCWAFGCTVGDDSTCYGGHCIAVNDHPTLGNHCVDTCTTNADCREAEGYRCFDPDGDGGEPSYCRHPQAGDACTTPADCGGGDWTCLTGADFPGGHCTVTGCPTGASLQGCGPNAVCYDDPNLAENHCIDRCPAVGGQSTCRSGYTCTAVGGFGACLPD